MGEYIRGVIGKVGQFSKVRVRFKSGSGSGSGQRQFRFRYRFRSHGWRRTGVGGSVGGGIGVQRGEEHDAAAYFTYFLFPSLSFPLSFSLYISLSILSCFNQSVLFSIPLLNSLHPMWRLVHTYELPNPNPHICVCMYIHPVPCG